MSTAKGLLLVLMQPPAESDGEFNAWYDTALRYVCLSGWPRYLALYDLDEPALLDALRETVGRDPAAAAGATN